MCGTGFQRVPNEVDSLVFEGDISLLGVNAAVVFAEKVPTQHKVENKIPNDTTVGSHEATIDPKGDVDNANGVDSAAINANGFPLEGFHLVVEKVGVFEDEFLTDTGSLTTCVTQSFTHFPVDFDMDFGFV